MAVITLPNQSKLRELRGDVLRKMMQNGEDQVGKHIAPF